MIAHHTVRVYQNRTFAQLDLVLAGVLAVAAVYVAVVRHPHPLHSLTSSGRWTTVFVLALLAVRGLLLSRCAVIVDERSDRFIVQNPLIRYDVTWADVERIDTGFSHVAQLWPAVIGSLVMVVYLVDGSKVKCAALRGATNAKAQQFEAEFNRLLQKRRQSDRRSPVAASPA